MTDLFANHAPSLQGPATDAFAITPNDTTNLGQATRALYCGSGGSLSITMLSGATVTFDSLPDGSLLPVRASKVLATGTTASSILGLV